MEIIYQWQILQMDTKPQEGNLYDVVVNVNWGRTAKTVVNDIEYTAYNGGAYACQTPSETDFTAYPDLTFDQVVGWIESGTDVEQIDLYLQRQLDNEITPPVIVLPLPWVTTTTTTTYTPENLQPGLQ